MNDELLTDILNAINREKAKDPPCGTALVINNILWHRLTNNYPDLSDRMVGVDVIPDEKQQGFIVENWEWTQ